MVSTLMPPRCRPRWAPSRTALRWPPQFRPPVLRPRRQALCPRVRLPSQRPKHQVRACPRPHLTMCTPLSLSSAQRKKTRYVQRRKLTAIHVGTYKLTVWNSACPFNVFIASKFAQRTLVASDNICSNVLPISA